ncbi:830_t:CDS:10 [Entrophospora sp. SA101]|nr:830_t:CDS:10 [Entrophospora sp. SA101]
MPSASTSSSSTSKIIDNVGSNTKPKSTARKNVKNNQYLDDYQYIESLDVEGDFGSIFDNYNKRFNYASFGCGALTLKANEGAKHISAIISESKDSYLINQCSSNKFVIVELCSEILIDTISLANYEFFSSTFKDFRVSISQMYPPKDDWMFLGQYRARNTREIQVFKVEQPLIFVKFMRIEFLSHYGSQFYCPVSLLQVYGLDEKEKWKKELEEISQLSLNQLNDTQEDSIKKLLPSFDDSEEELDKILPKMLGRENDSNTQIDSSNKYDNDYNYNNGSNNEDRQSNDGELVNKIKTKKKNPLGLKKKNPHNKKYLIKYKSPLNHSTIIILPDNSFLTERKCYTDKSPTHISHSDLLTSKDMNIFPSRANSAVVAQSKSPTQNTKDDNGSQINLQLNNGRTQESIFKTIVTRISALELNATLSQRYMEEHNRILKEVFSKIEKSQSRQLKVIMDHFNETIGEIRREYVELLKITIKSIENKQINQEMELNELSEKLDRLASEVAFIKLPGLLFILLLIILIGVSQNWCNLKNSFIKSIENKQINQEMELNELSEKLDRLASEVAFIKLPGLLFILLLIILIGVSQNWCNLKNSFMKNLPIKILLSALIESISLSPQLSSQSSLIIPTETTTALFDGESKQFNNIVQCQKAKEAKEVNEVNEEKGKEEGIVDGGEIMDAKNENGMKVGENELRHRINNCRFSHLNNNHRSNHHLRTSRYLLNRPIRSSRILPSPSPSPSSLVMLGKKQKVEYIVEFSLKQSSTQKSVEPNLVALLELIATGSIPKLKKHFEQDSVMLVPHWPFDELQGRGLNIRLVEPAILTDDVELYSPDEIPGPDRNKVTEQILK